MPRFFTDGLPDPDDVFRERGREMRQRIAELQEVLDNIAHDLEEMFPAESVPPRWAMNAEENRPLLRMVVQGINDRGEQVSCKCDRQGNWYQLEGRQWVPAKIRCWWRTYWDWQGQQDEVRDDK